MRRLAAPLLACLAASAAMADAQRVEVPLSRTEPVVGVPVVFDGKVAYTVVADTCEPMPIELTVHMDDLDRRLTDIARASGLERTERCGTSIAVHDARLGRQAGDLQIRIDGHVEREECVVVFGNTIATRYGSDATLTGVLRPLVIEGKLRTELVGEPQLTVQDPLLQAAVELLDLDGQLGRDLARSVGDSLAQPESALELPDELVGFQISYEAARIDDVDGRLSLVVNALASRTQPAFGGFLDYLAGFAGGSVASPACP